MRIAKYAPYEERVIENEALYNELYNQFLLKLIEENIDLFTDEDLADIELFKNGFKKTDSLSGHIKSIVGNSLKSDADLYAFSSEADKLLESEDTDFYIREKLIKMRILSLS